MGTGAATELRFTMRPRPASRMMGTTTRFMVTIPKKFTSNRDLASSVAAPVPIPFQTYYSATKAAVNAYTMALANELRPFGVTVCAVMPGDIHTGFTAARRKIAEGDDIYQGRIGRSVARMEHDEETGMDPAKAGGYIAKVALREGNRHPLYAIRFDYKFFVFLTKVLPARFLNWLIYQLYGK